MFNTLPVNRFIFDFGGEEKPDFSFLSLLPEDSQVALCLLDGNANDIADADEILAQIDQASEVIDTDRLGLSTRHGFYPRDGDDSIAAYEHQEAVFVVLLDASSRAWGIDF